MPLRIAFPSTMRVRRHGLQVPCSDPPPETLNNKQPILGGDEHAKVRKSPQNMQRTCSSPPLHPLSDPIVFDGGPEHGA